MASSRSFTRPKPEIGVLPVVVKTRSEPKKRGSRSKIARAARESGTSCTRPFFAMEQEPSK